MKPSTEMKDALNRYLDSICDDYAKWARSVKPQNDERCEEMINEFEAAVSYTVGKKYVRVTIGPCGQESAHSFIVNSHDDKKFPYGTILKPAGWKAPARNFGRGDVFTNYSHIQWTEAH